MDKKKRVEKRELRTYNQYKKAKQSGNGEKAGRKYDKLVDRQMDSIKAGVDVQYKKKGGSTYDNNGGADNAMKYFNDKKHDTYQKRAKKAEGKATDAASGSNFNSDKVKKYDDKEMKNKAKARKLRESGKTSYK